MSEKLVQLNQEMIKWQIRELVCGRVEESLIEMRLTDISAPLLMKNITKTLWAARSHPLRSVSRTRKFMFILRTG